MERALVDPSRRRFKVVVGVVATAGLLALAGVRVIDLRTQRSQLLQAGDRRAANIAVVLAGYLRQTFLAVDASLRQLRLHSQRIGGPDAKDSEWLPALVSAHAALTAVGSISVMDSAGIVRHSTQPVIIGQSRRTNYVFRRLAADTSDDLVADPPFRALAGVHTYLIPLARRLPTPNGGFGGIIVATVIPDELRNVFRAPDLGAQGVVTVFHSDGFVVFREPSRTDPIGEAAARQPLFEASRHTDTNDVFRGRASPGGVMLRTAYRTLPDRDLIVAVSLGEDELLGEWRRDVTISGIIGALLLTALAAILYLIFREMDTRLAAEETLQRSQRLESIGRLTGGIAHDFNNLLTVILGNVALIQDGLGTDPPEATAESAAQIERAANRGTALIRQLLAFARRRPLQSRTVDLNALIADTRPMLDRVLGEDVVLTVNAAHESHHFATVDPAGLESALLNLCINARDAMPNGGHITVNVSRVTLDAQYARENTDATPGHYVAVSVRDDGAGIPAEHLSHLFEPFFTTKTAGRGTGLGLSSVYGFVKQSAGHVKVASDVGSGTVFTLYFPEATDSSAVAAPPEEGQEDSREGAGETILVVEDEPDLLALATRFLEELGYRVIGAENGKAALEVAQHEQRIDLLLSDMVMPGGMSGRQLAKALCAKRPALPVLFVSGYPDDVVDDAPDAVNAPIVTKPYDRAHLAAAVRKALRANA
jgi:signal transduction histidine kinase/CheY-like chemotaxis protein